MLLNSPYPPTQGKIQRLGVKQLEVKIVAGIGTEGVLVPIRVVASNPTGYAVRVETYVEVRVDTCVRVCVCFVFASLASTAPTS